MPSTRMLTLVAVATLAVLAAAVLGTAAGNEHAERADGGGAGSRATMTAPPRSPAPTGAPTTPDSPTPASPTSSSAAAGPPAEEDPTIGTEIGPAPATPTPTAYRLPPTTVRQASLLGRRIPRAGVARARLVPGFPAALVPPPGARIVTSSLAVRGRRVQVALVVTGLDGQSGLAHYRGLLAPLGFVERELQGVENAPAAAFVRGMEDVTVSASPDGTTSLLAHLRARTHD